LRVAVSLKVLVTGYALGVALAAVLTALATSSKLGASLLETLTAMLNPLPSIALLPLALLWFGIGEGSLLFVLLHAVTWVVAMNTFSGFRGVSQTQRMVGHNYGLGLFRFIAQILIPAAFPSILAGLKTGWAFAWRTLVAAELIFGTSSGTGGLGWFIFENKNDLQIANVFAGLLTVIVIGLLVDSLLFRTIERYTVQRWGMQGR
jgi:NitT/TauT family transport system permease protein